MGLTATNIKNLDGDYGGEYFNDTSAHTPESGTDAWFAIMAANGADAVIDTLASNITGLNTSGLAFTLSSGHVIYGNFTSVTLTSGAVICYKKKK